MILAIGLVTPLPPLPEELAEAIVIHAAAAALSATMLTRVLPDAIVAPLCGVGFDIIELGEKLQALGYGGRLVVVAPPLPDRALVEREIAAACRDIPVVVMTSA